MQPRMQARRFVVAVARQSCLHANLATRAAWTHANFCTPQPMGQGSAPTVPASARRLATATSAPTTRSDFIVTPPSIGHYRERLSRDHPQIALRSNVENRVKSGAGPWRINAQAHEFRLSRAA